MRKKVCVVTAARSEYGVLRWLMEELKNERTIELQIVVTGSHLSPEYGFTYKEIEKDGFRINYKVDMHLSARTEEDVAKAMGYCGVGIAEAYKALKPDLLVVLGDRYELLPICGAALVMRIPIAHISGGDVTAGVIDDMIRHAVTKMANLHFPGTDESAKRIIQMGEDPRHVFVVGELGLDNFRRLSTLSRKELAEDIGLNENNKWILMSYHPETTLPLKKTLKRLNNTIDFLNGLEKCQIIITYPNADYGSEEIIEIIKNISKIYPHKFKLINNLGQLRYLSLMKEVYCLIGNSSSGIVETPYLKKPFINIGKRQEGRKMCKNIITIEGDIGSLKKAFFKLDNHAFYRELKNIVNPYGAGDSAIKIKNILKKIDITKINNKIFRDINPHISRSE